MRLVLGERTRVAHGSVPAHGAKAASARRCWRSRALTRCGTVARLASVLSALPGASCKVGPDYARPEAEVAERWLDHEAVPQPPAADPRWWKSFGDPVLESLVERALAQNLDLRQAGLRVIQARAVLGIAAGQFFPQTQEVVGSIAANHFSPNSASGRGDNTWRDYSIGILAAWELDFWGRFRRGIESAEAVLEASVADYDAALVLLAADVASRYVEIRSLQEQLGLTAENIQAQQDTLELTRVRFQAGAASELDVSTAQATLANTQAILPGLEDALRGSTLALCVLLGATPSVLESELGAAGPVPDAPAEIALGIPADLLRRRPDVRRAERIAAALSAEIGVATADLYPSIAVRGATGFRAASVTSGGVSPEAGDLLDADSFEGFVGLGFAWPFLDYGRIRNNIRLADARFQEAAVAYQDSVLRAAADVEAGLSSFLRSREEAAFLGESVAAARRTVELSLIQYRQGAADFLRVNQAQVDLVERQNSLVVARANVAQGAISTYRALGGGWEAHVGQEFVPRQTIDEMRARTDWGDVLGEVPPRAVNAPPSEHLAAAGGPPAGEPRPMETRHDEPR